MSEKYKSWRGTAAELAKTATEWLESLGFEGHRLNERLVRYYVQEGVLSRPERDGREAIFGFRQLLEFVVARKLADDGWPLAKIASWNRGADETALLELVDDKQLAAPPMMRTVMGQVFPETRRLVLAVNDDPEADLDIYEWLASRGVAVLRAYTNEQAMALLDRTRVHVVISDLGRIEGDAWRKVRGVDLVRLIREEKRSDVPIVIYTMNRTPQVKELTIDTGANYVTEDPDDLQDWLEKMGI